MSNCRTPNARIKSENAPSMLRARAGERGRGGDLGRAAVHLRPLEGERDLSRLHVNRAPRLLASGGVGAEPSHMAPPLGAATLHTP